MTPKTPTDHLALLIQFQKWRKGDDEIEQPDPRDISEAIDYAIQCCEAVQSRAKAMRHNEITEPGIYLAKTEVGDEVIPLTIQADQINLGTVFMGFAYQGPIEWVEEL